MFKEVESLPDFPKKEQELLKHWYESGIVAKYLHKNDGADKKFFFQDGPITANNPMGVHHAWGRTYKDVWQRFKNMQGFEQRFQNGFDCQGLWVEVEVEKELGFKSKKDIEKFGVEKFIQLCKDRVIKYAKVQTEQSIRLGYLMDWDNSYFTMSDENNYMIWHFLKKCHEDGYIYKGHDSVPWCYRCGTAISQHEMLTEDYKEVTHKSVYIMYPVSGEKNTYLLAWTTTPWTLPGNVACAVDSEKEYALTSGSEPGNKYYLLKDLAQTLDLSIEKVVKGSELVGLEYTSPFDHLPRVQEAFKGYKHRVIATDSQILPVSDSEGTGIVHIAPGAGTEDFQLAKKFNLPVVDLIDEAAVYLDGMNDFSGKNAKIDPEIILAFLTEKGSVFKISPITHRYPACWRCKAELVWRVVDEWYIGMDRGKKHLRERMRKVVQKIKWIPSFGLEREMDWLKNMHDWLISKKRYWGLALPIWVCETCSKFEVMGGKEELKERAVEGWDDFEGKSPHKPQIDQVKLKCSCGGTMSRIPDVGNPWLDAGIVPFSTLVDPKTGQVSYTSDKKYWKKWFPADFITESFPGQFKNWFYSLIAMSTELEDTNPFNCVLGYASVLAEDGRAMHKSWGNAIEFNEGADKMGVDVMRWIYVKHSPERNLLFGYKIADETRRQFHMLLWNSFRFFVNYAFLENWKFDKNAEYKLKPLDEWILSRLNQTVSVTTESLENYDAFMAATELESFVQDLSLWYIRRSRDRIGPSASDLSDKQACYSTLYAVFEALSRLLAPFTPFIADQIYTNITDLESVNLADWPIASEVNTQLIDDMVIARQICEAAHAKRKEAAIAVKQPLASVTVLGPSGGVAKSEGLIELIKDELNVKAVLFDAKASDNLEVKIDTKLTEELELEGMAREFIRSVQGLRKTQGLKIGEKVNVEYVSSDKLEKALGIFDDYIKNKAGIKELKPGESLKIV